MPLPAARRRCSSIARHDQRLRGVPRAARWRCLPVCTRHTPRPRPRARNPAHSSMTALHGPRLPCHATGRSAPTTASHAGAPPPPAVAYRCRVSAQFASVPACTGTRRFGLRSTGRKSRRGAAPRPGAVHRFAGLSWSPRCSRLDEPGHAASSRGKGPRAPLAKSGIAALNTA